MRWFSGIRAVPGIGAAFKGGLTTRLLAPILLALCVLIAGYTAFWQLRSARDMTEAFDEMADLTVVALRSPVAAALWDFDKDAAQTALEGMASNRSLAFARVDTAQGTFADEIFTLDDEGAKALLSEFGAEESGPRVVDHGVLVARVEILRVDGERVGQLVLGFDRTQMLDAQRRALTSAGLIGVGVFALMGAVVWLLARSVTGPLRVVVHDIARLRDGDTDFHVSGAERSDELGELSRSVEVFRQTLIEKRNLEHEEDEHRRQRAEAERQQAAEEAAHQEQIRERERENARQEAERQRQREMQAQEAAREAQERQAEQQAVVSNLAEGLSRLAGGDLSVQISATFAEEYDQLRRDFNDTALRLHDVISALSGSASVITERTAEIGDASNDLARRTEQTAATLEETAAAIEELTSSVGETARGASETDGLARKSCDEARSGREVAAQAVAAMQEIEDYSARISKIMDVINDIAFQTNLLALNAGVEAARAGETGRGFAVVAAEVRALAQRTSEASKEISGLIADSSERVSIGVELVGQNDSALGRIVTSIETISERLGGVSAAAAEQSDTLGSLNGAISELDSGTQQNAAMFAETQGATGQLVHEAQELTQMMAFFRLKEGSMQVTHAA